MSNERPRSTDGNSAASTGDSPVFIGRLLLEMLRKQVTLMVRYRINFLTNLIGGYLFFAILFFGGSFAATSAGMSSKAIAPSLDGFIVGWFLFMIAQASYGSLPGSITKESEWGTLEQLYLSPYGFGRVMSAKVLVTIFQSLFMGGLMLGIALVTTQRSLAIDVVTILPVLLLGMLSIVGIGYVFAGLALIYKRIEAMFSHMRFVLVGLVAAPVADIPWLQFLPLVQSSSMLQDAMRAGTRIWEFPVADLAILLVVGIVYALLGYIVFLYCSIVARKRGVMGHY